MRLKADEGGLVLEVNAEPPPDVLTALRAAKPDLLRILAGREAAKAALKATAPPDCLPRRWTKAQDGLRRFVNDGYGDQATLLGWTIDELYRVPPVWAGSTSPAPPCSSPITAWSRSPRVPYQSRRLPAPASGFAGPDGSTWHDVFSVSLFRCFRGRACE